MPKLIMANFDRRNAETVINSRRSMLFLEFSATYIFDFAENLKLPFSDLV